MLECEKARIAKIMGEKCSLENRRWHYTLINSSPPGHNNPGLCERGLQNALLYF